MRAREGSQVRRFRQVESFVEELKAPIATQALDVVRERLRRIIERIETRAREHNSMTRHGHRKTQELLALLEDLRDDHMLPVSELARSRAEAPPGLAIAVKSPHKRTAVQKTLAAAHGMLNVATRHAEWFEEEGLPRGVLEGFGAAITAVERVIAERDSLRRRQIEASSAIQLELHKGKRAVLGLNAVLRKDLKVTPELLATWKKIKRVGG